MEYHTSKWEKKMSKTPRESIHHIDVLQMHCQVFAKKILCMMYEVCPLSQLC